MKTASLASSRHPPKQDSDKKANNTVFTFCFLRARANTLFQPDTLPAGLPRSSSLKTRSEAGFSCCFVGCSANCRPKVPQDGSGPIARERPEAPWHGGAAGRAQRHEGSGKGSGSQLFSLVPCSGVFANLEEDPKGVMSTCRWSGASAFGGKLGSPMMWELPTSGLEIVCCSKRNA